MVVQERPSTGPVPLEQGSEAGVIEDARRRQRRHRRVGVAVIAAALAAALLLGPAGGGGGGGAGHSRGGRPSGSGRPAGSGHSGSARLFTGAPPSQPNQGVVTDACPLARANRYLPRWSGCVTARVADLSGAGRPDLLLVYSRLAHHRIRGTGTVRHALYRARQAVLRVVTADGALMTRPIHGSLAADVVSVTGLNDRPGKQILLRINRTSSGATMALFSVSGRRLVAAGPLLGAGGDSASAAGFDCLTGPPRVIRRAYELIHGMKLVGGEIYGVWRETLTTFEWRGPRLVMVARRVVRGRLLPRETVGGGCLRGR